MSRKTPQDASSPEAYKQEGNNLYNQCNFDGAEAKYTQGITHCPSNNEEDLRMMAVLHSNRANARFEKGDYDGAIQDSGDALKFLSPEETNLINKNSWRLARAIFSCDTADSDSILEGMAQSCKTTDPELSSKIENLAKVSASKLSGSGSCSEFSPQLLRNHLLNPYVELYPFGHDVAVSALEKENEPSADRDEYRILYGGVGDARHVMATILDANSRNRKPKLRVTMNDIKACTLLKDVVVLIVSRQIAELVSDAEAAMDDKKACLLVAVIYYSTMGFVMPAVVYKELQSIIRRTFLRKSREDFMAAYPWFVIHSSDWEVLVDLARYWVDTSLYKETPLPSVGEALAMYKPKSKSELGEMFGQDYSELKREKLGKDLERWGNIKNYSPEDIDHIRSNHGEHLTDQEVVETMLELVENVHNFEGSSDEMALSWDKHYSKMTGALMPPVWNGIRLKELLDPDAVLDPPSDETDSNDVVRVKNHILESWKTNPVRFDPGFLRFDACVGNSDFAVEWVNFYFHDGVTKNFQDKMTETEVVELLFRGTLFQHVSKFFFNLGLAIRNLVSSKHLLIEISTGSILDFCANAEVDIPARQKSGLPMKFSHVYMSNIPDYTGMLSITLGIYPLLEANSKVHNNVLMNTGLFKSYDEYLFGTFGLTERDLAKFLGVVSIGKKTDVWNDFNCWGIASRHSCINPQEVKRWLHRVFLMTAFPPQRDPNIMCREERPNTLDMFLRLCSFCIHTLEYPVHWIMGALDELLVTELKSKATIANDSPSRFIPEIKNNIYNLSSCLEELKNCMALWINSGNLPRTLTKFGKLPSGNPVKIIYTLPYCPDVSGCNTSKILGMLLEKKADSRFDEEDTREDSYARMMSMMMGGAMMSNQTQESKLRRALLDKGQSTGHLFSCVQFDKRDNSISFWMCEDIFEKYASYQISIIRTDGWFRLQWSKQKLGDCKRV